GCRSADSRRANVSARPGQRAHSAQQPGAARRWPHGAARCPSPSECGERQPDRCARWRRSCRARHPRRAVSAARAVRAPAGRSFATGAGGVSDLVRLLAWLRPVKARILVSIALGVAAVVTSPGLLGVATYVVAVAALRPPLAELTGALFLVRMFGLSRAFARYGERIVSHDVTFRLLARLRVVVFGQLARLAAGQL